MLTADQLAALERHLQQEFRFKLLDAASPEATVLRAVADALVSALPVPGRAAVSEVTERLRNVSVTVWTPLGTVVLLSAYASGSSGLVVRARTVAHEAVHARQVLHLGAQSIPDYLGSAELRATREAQACVVAAWVEHLFTGRLQASAADVVASLGSCLYCLGTGEKELARGIAESGLETMRRGGVPPYDVAVSVLRWAQEHAPEAIEAVPHRVTAVPS